MKNKIKVNLTSVNCRLTLCKVGGVSRYMYLFVRSRCYKMSKLISMTQVI